jgi:hypothetical protein
MNIQTMVEATVTAEREALDRLGEEIALLSAHISVATARLLEKIRDFDARHAWRVSMDIGAAREHVRVARALPGLPLINAAFAAGELSYSKVRALTRVATAETEERLLAFARSGTASHVERLVRGWRRVAAPPRTRKRRSATGTARCGCIKTQTAWLSSKAG